MGAAGTSESEIDTRKSGEVPSCCDALPTESTDLTVQLHNRLRVFARANSALANLLKKSGK